MRQLAAWTVALAVLGLAGADRAIAHAGDPNIQTLVLGVAPSLPGVTITVIQDTLVPSLSAVNTSPGELEILGPDREPFLRLGPGGADGNINSPNLYRSRAPSGEAPVPARVRQRGLAPRWVRISRRPAWAWYDTRVPSIASAPQGVRARQAPARLATWSIPLRYDARPARANGVVDYRPPTGGVISRLTSPMRIAPGVTVVLLPGRSPDLFVQNAGPEVVTVLGQQNEPFAQIGPRGVLVNLRSPIHAADVSARGGNSTVSPDASAPPLWRRVSTATAYDWLDPRPHFEPHWTIPMRIGSRLADVTGTLSYQPATAPGTVVGLGRAAGTRRRGGTSMLVLLASAVALALAALVTVATVRRRRARAALEQRR